MKLSKYKFDIIIISIFLAIALAHGGFLYTKKSNDLVAHIIDCNSVKTTYKLSNENDNERLLTIDGLYSNVIVALDKEGVRVVSSECPHLDCVKTGKITRNGQSIICLYNKVVVELKNSSVEDIYL